MESVFIFFLCVFFSQNSQVSVLIKGPQGQRSQLQQGYQQQSAASLGHGGNQVQRGLTPRGQAL